MHPNTRYVLVLVVLYVWMVIAGIWLLLTNLQCQAECSQNGNV